MEKELDDILKQADEIESSSSSRKIVQKFRSYIDPSTGRETFYVKNYGNTQLYFTELHLTIKKGEIVDLLSKNKLEKLYDCPELNTYLSNAKKLKRLTKEEYDHECAVREEMNQRIEQYKIEQENRIKNPALAPTKGKSETVSSSVIFKVSMLKKFYSSDPAMIKTAINPAEFMQWASCQNFNNKEIEHIIDSIDDSDVKSFMYKRKKELFN